MFLHNILSQIPFFQVNKSSSGSSSDSDSDSSSSSSSSDESEKDFGKKTAPTGTKKKVEKVDDQHYDEAMSVSEDEVLVP